MALWVTIVFMTKTLKSRKKSKNSYRHGDLRSALIDVALERFNRSGEVDFTLRDLAKKTGVSHVAVYRHFSSKKHILKEIATLGFARLKEYFDKSLENDPTAIIDLGEAYVRFAIENPSFFRVMFHPDLKPDDKDPEFGKLGSEAFSVLQKCVALNKSEDRFSDDTIEELSITAWSLVHGLSVLWVNGNLQPLPDGSKRLPDNLARTVSTLLTKGLLRR